MTPSDEEYLKRKILFTPPKTKKGLHDWIHLFLKIDVPDGVVCHDEGSTSPMEAVWTIYEKALRNDDPDFNRVMIYSAREGYKCTEKGTLLLTKDRGFLPIEEANIGDIIWSGKAWRKITHHIHDGIKPGVKLSLENGLTLTTSFIHRVWAWEEGGRPDWKRVSELTENDLVCVDTSADFSDVKIDSNQYEIGYLWGLKNCYSYGKEIPAICYTSYSYMVGFISGLFDTDGTITAKETLELPITAEKLLRQLLSVLHGLGVNARFRSNRRLYSNQRQLVHHLIVNQVDIPKLLKAGVKLTANKARGVTEETLNPRVYDNHDTIPNGHFAPFLSNLPINGGRKKKNVKKPRLYRANYKSYSRYKLLDVVTYAEANRYWPKGEVQYWRQQLSNKWLKVRSLTEVQADFYDLTVEEDHSYWSNGLISHNTLLASVVQCIMMVLFSKEICTLSAIEDQSKKMKKYLWEHLNNPILREFMVGDNRRSIEFCRYENKLTGDSITEKQWATLPEVEKNRYERYFANNIVLVASKQSCNGQHPNFFTCDEIDVMTPAGRLAYEEAKMVPTVHNGKYPITLLVSTRKSQAGLVQREIDEAERTGLKILHWNILDVTEKCPPTRHLAILQEDGTLQYDTDCPKVTIYRSDETLEAISEVAFNNLPPDRQKKFVKDEGYKGCIDNCRIFAGCRGRLINQTGTGALMKKIPAVQNTFRAVTPETAQAQLLCRKPSKEGLVYPRLERSTHMLTASQMAKKLTGYDYPVNFSKNDLIKLAKERECQFYSGMDHGFSHAFAVITGFRDGSRMFIVDAVEVEGFELPQKLALCDSRIKHLQPIIYPDTSDPGSNQTFRRHGFKMRDWDKFKGSIVAGIEIVRLKLNPQSGDPELYFLSGDDGVENAFLRISRYQWAMDTGGNPTDKPDKTDDHSSDALRYLILNVFAPDGKLIVSKGGSQSNVPAPLPINPEKPSLSPFYDPESAWNQMVHNAGLETEEERGLIKIGGGGSVKRGVIWSDDD